MTKFRLEKEKIPKISFVDFQGQKVYAHYGTIKTYTNMTQAQNAAEKLQAQGISVSISSWPHKLILTEK